MHTDEPTVEDSLNRKPFASALAQVAQTCATPLVIDLYGTWGIGETSLMQQVEKQLD